MPKLSDFLVINSNSNSVQVLFLTTLRTFLLMLKVNDLSVLFLRCSICYKLLMREKNWFRYIHILGGEYIRLS